VSAVVALVLAANAGTATPSAGEDAQPQAAPAPSLDQECLTIKQSSAATYMIENTACATQSVLAAIELSTDNAEARCFTKKIRTQISIASEHAAPVVNYQCIEGTQNCSVETLRGMFPECHAG
jgi:hypothetical protein